MSIKRLLDQVFFEVPDAVFDLTTGTVGIKKGGNIVTASVTTNDEDGKSTIEVMHNVLSEFGMAIPAFGIKVPLNEVRVGDIVIFANKQVGGFAEKVNEFGFDFEKASRPESAKGFVPVAKRWVVERSISWTNYFRRLVKDYEYTTSSSVAWLYLANTQLMLQRIGTSNQT